MTTIASFRTKILALLDDASSLKYTSAQVDAAMALALEDYSLYRPNVLTYIMDAPGTQRITLPASLAAPGPIRRVERLNKDSFTDEVTFYAYLQDNQWVIETSFVIVPSTADLVIEYHAAHTIDGFLGSAGTTVPDHDDNLLALGAAGYAAATRVITIIETNNLNPNEAKDLDFAFKGFLSIFRLRLSPGESLQASASWADSSIDKAY